MSASRQLWKGSAFLLVANVLAGVLHYLFQVRAAGHLPVAEYGDLNAWMAYLGVALSVAVVAQMASNFVILDGSQLRKIGIAVLVLALGLSACWFATAAGKSPIGMLAGCVLLGVAFHGVLGQIQAKTWFGRMGFAVFGVGVFKIGYAWLAPGNSGSGALANYYWAIPISYAMGCLVELGILAGTSGKAALAAVAASVDSSILATASSANPRRWTALGPAAVLAFATNWIPQMDLLNLRWLQSDATIGEYSRAALYAKAIFFAAITLLQVTLPYHVTGQKAGADPALRTKILRLEKLGLLACVVGSFVLAYLSPWVSRTFLGFDLAGRQIWVLLSCLALTALYGQLQVIQLACAVGRWKSALSRVSLFGVFMVIIQVWRPASVTEYLAAAFGFYLLLNGVDGTARAVLRARARPTQRRS